MHSAPTLASCSMDDANLAGDLARRRTRRHTWPNQIRTEGIRAPARIETEPVDVSVKNRTECAATEGGRTARAVSPNE
jgi:hypothetical protein